MKMVTVNISTYFKNYVDLDEKIVEYINDYVNDSIMDANHITKSGDLYTDINSGYYTQRRYITKDTYSSVKMEEDIENVVNDNCKPRDYKVTLSNSIRYAKSLINKKIKSHLNDDNWKSDWVKYNNLCPKEDKELIEKLFNFIYDWDTDECDKASKLDDLLEIYKFGRG